MLNSVESSLPLISCLLMLIGTMIYSQKREEFVVKQGPIFANFILADEINRAPAKVQSALLEAMQERQVTIGDMTYRFARTIPGYGHPESDRAGRYLSAYLKPRLTVLC